MILCCNTSINFIWNANIEFTLMFYFCADEKTRTPVYFVIKYH
jgi:hypothetical protein